jgi:hypothetical protein
MQDNATLVINSMQNLNGTLSLNARSFYRNRTLEIFSSDMLVAQISVPETFINVSMPISLTKGVNTMRFHVTEGCDRPCDIEELNNIDSRCLGVGIQNINVA